MRCSPRCAASSSPITCSPIAMMSCSIAPLRSTRFVVRWASTPPDLRRARHAARREPGGRALARTNQDTQLGTVRLRQGRHQRPADRFDHQDRARHAARRHRTGRIVACDFASVANFRIRRRRSSSGSKTKDDIVKEMDSELQMPGWGNVWTQPIINRVNMLATGVRTQIGVKVFGPTGKSLPDAIAGRAARERGDRRPSCSTIPGAVDCVRGTGRPARGMSRSRSIARRPHDTASTSPTSRRRSKPRMGGGQVTTTVEGRQRFPVRLQVPREYWQDVDSLGDVLVTGRMTSTKPQATNPSSNTEGSGMNAESSSGEATLQRPLSSAMPSGSTIQIPLRMVANIRIVDGPSMIKSRKRPPAQLRYAQRSRPRHRRVRRRSSTGDQAHRGQARRHGYERRVVGRIREPGARQADAHAHLPDGDRADPVSALHHLQRHARHAAGLSRGHRGARGLGDVPGDLRVQLQRDRLHRLHRRVRHGHRDRRDHAGLPARSDRPPWRVVDRSHRSPSCETS